MLDFICILLIFFEIIFTVFCVKKLISLEIKVNEIHIKTLEGGKKLLETIDETRKVIKKINKVIRILANKRLHQIKRIIMMTIDIIQVIILLKSLKTAKNLKTINFSLLKNLAIARVGQEVLKKILASFENFCAI